MCWGGGTPGRHQKKESERNSVLLRWGVQHYLVFDEKFSRYEKFGIGFLLTAKDGIARAMYSSPPPLLHILMKERPMMKRGK